MLLREALGRCVGGGARRHDDFAAQQLGHQAAQGLERVLDFREAARVVAQVEGAALRLDDGGDGLALPRRQRAGANESGELAGGAGGLFDGRYRRQVEREGARARAARSGRGTA
jgi:hypothetical protein